jgi:hypothetical protein
VPEDPVVPVESVTGLVTAALVPLELPLAPRVEPPLLEPVEFFSGCVATFRLTVAVALSTALTTSVRLLTVTLTDTLA